VEVRFRCWNWRLYAPIPFTPPRIVEEKITVMTDAKGTFAFKGKLPRLEFSGATKAGYKLDGAEKEYMWQPLGTGPAKTWTLHLMDVALVRPDQIRAWNLEAIPFGADGRIGIDVVEGKEIDAASADLVFHWERLQATAAHGEYGKLAVIVPKGGLWSWGEERLLAPKENYERGMVFFFEPRFMNAERKERRAEFFIASRDGQVYGRVYAQLNTGKSTLSLRARINHSGSRFVEYKNESYATGNYASLSPDNFNSEVPWWLPTGPRKGQVILSTKRAGEIFGQDPGTMPVPDYFAGHYQTPPTVLKAIAGSPLMRDFKIVRALSGNLAAPKAVLEQLKTNEGKSEDFEAAFSAPEDLKQFLTAPE